MVQTYRRSDTNLFGEMLDAAKVGDDSAWESLYRGLAGSVTGYLASRGAKDPEDLAGEVFLQVARDIHRFEGNESSLRSWVFVIAHRRLIDARRAENRRPALASSVEVSSDDILGGDVEAEAIDQLALTRLHEILDSLTENQRDVLALRVVADLSLEETAKVMGKRVGAIKAVQRRALLALRDQIEQGRVTL